MGRSEAVNDSRLIDALYTLDSARRGILELRYSRGLYPAEIAGLLDLSSQAVTELMEEGVEKLILSLDLGSLEQGVGLIVKLTKLSREAWGDQTEDEIVELARLKLSRSRMSAARI